VLCSPDKDLAQCVRADRVVQFDRRSGETRNASAVLAKFGVPPESIPDYLALVGDSADGFPGLPGWGAKSASTVLAEYLHLAAIPRNVTNWTVKPRAAAKLAATLRERWDDALLFRTLATLRTDLPPVTVDELRFHGPTPAFEALAARWRRPELTERARAAGAHRRR
jgi:5'-3' exonuclease